VRHRPRLQTWCYSDCVVCPHRGKILLHLAVGHPGRE
jgi:hypothetical protein